MNLPQRTEPTVTATVGARPHRPNVFVGNGARVLKGVTIGAHAAIAAGSVVTTSIPEGVIAAGNPARVIREL
jgi:acetyltransferase-like isoleucine patch superfamily enzyme